jgi:hypothetical protein
VPESIRSDEDPTSLAQEAADLLAHREVMVLAVLLQGEEDTGSDAGTPLPYR